MSVISYIFRLLLHIRTISHCDYPFLNIQWCCLYFRPGEGPSRERGRPRRDVAKLIQDSKSLSSPTIQGLCDQSKPWMKALIVLNLLERVVVCTYAFALHSSFISSCGDAATSHAFSQ